MKSRKRLDETHWEILKSAYLGKRQDRIIPGWQAEVMRRIRGILLILLRRLDYQGLL